MPKLKTHKISAVENFREFYESVGKLYPEEEIVFKTLRGLVRRDFVASYLRQFRGRLLDLGCNRGYYIAQYSNGTAIGVDVAFSVLQKASRRLPGTGFLLGDAQKLGFLKPASFDAILCSEVIEHVRHAQRLMTGCFELLKPRGQILITTPNYKKEKPTWINVGAMEAYGVEGVRGNQYFHTAYRPDELREMAEIAGFRRIEIGTFEKEVKYATRIPVTFYHLSRLINKAVFHSATLDTVSETLLNKSSLLIYKASKALGLNKIFVGMVKEGVRSYLFATK
ncbi:MAG: class I SAM-dependent methyltransferase [bacterium]